MQRLRDPSDVSEVTDAERSAIAELRRLVHAVRDIEPPAGAQDRVRSALTASGDRSTKPWWRHAVLPATVVAVAVVVVTVATTGSSPWERERATPVFVPRMAGPAAGSMVPVGPTAAGGSSTAADPTLAGPVVPAITSPALVGPRAPKPEGSHRGVGRSRVASSDRIRRSSLDDIPRPSSGREGLARRDLVITGYKVEGSSITEPSALVFDALRALAQQHDVQAAARLLDDYLEWFPDGDLAEEALSLAIKAHAAMHDLRTLTLADEYVRRYPQGRFRDVADQAKRTAESPF